MVFLSTLELHLITALEVGTILRDVWRSAIRVNDGIGDGRW